MPKFGYLVVEGPHDVEFACRLLKSCGLNRVQMVANLDSYFKPLVPPNFPPDGDLLKRVPVPTFIQSQSHVIAVHSAIGDSKLVKAIANDSKFIDYDKLTGIGILLDTDKDVTATKRYEDIKTKMKAIGHQLPEAAGAISAETPKMGAYVLPDNSSEGNLENLLIECADAAFPTLLASAIKHVGNARDDESFEDEKRENLNKTSQFNKAVVGAIATTLRPGRAVQASIQDNIWLKGNNLNLPKVKAVQDFLMKLFEIEP